MRKPGCVFLLVLLLLTAVCGTARAEGVSAMEVEALRLSCTYRDLGRKQAEKLPVYAAPFEDAWRGANGKAAVYTGEPFTVLGAAQDGAWLWVEYAVSAKESRVGWIHASHADGNRAVENCFPADGRLLRVLADTPLTDDPRGSRRVMRALKAGETVIALCAVTFDDGEDALLYVETEIDGRTAWGFADSAEMEEIPLTRLEGDTLIIREGVRAIGDFEVEMVEDEHGEMIGTHAMPVVPGTVRVDGLFFGETVPRAVRSVRFPDTLTYIGAEAIAFPQLDELRLPPSLETMSDYAIYAGSIGRLVIPAGYTGSLDVTERTVIDGYEVEEGNPRYRSVDGVLFSADGKTLIRYPNGRKALHYDVPQGVETLADHAFDDDLMSIPLQSVSLPIGLRKIGRYAFIGCGRLNSLAVPLTVTELAPNAFSTCVSLERLSLPPGLRAEKDRWTSFTDDTRFNGDNGESRSPYAEWLESDTEQTTDGDLWYEAVLVPRAGEERIPGYAGCAGDEVTASYAPGTVVTVHKVERGRALTQDYLGYDWEKGESLFREEWFDLDCLISAPTNSLFTVEEATFVEGDHVTNLGRPARLAKVQAFELRCAERQVCFSFPVDEETIEERSLPEGTEETLTLPMEEVTLLRGRTGDSRTLGLLLPEPGQALVTLRDAAEGAVCLTVGAGEQAEALEQTDGWLRVRTAHGEGWIPEEQYKEVIQEDE